MTTKDVIRIRTSFDPIAQVVTITGGEGRALTIPFTSLNESVRAYALAQGITKKVTDAAALSKDPETGQSATLDTKWQAIVAMHDRIVGPAGEWNIDPKRAATLRKQAQEALEWLCTIEALCTFKGTTPDTREGQALKAWAEGKGKEAVITLRNAKPELLAVYTAILADKKGKATSDESELDNMMDELDDL